MAIFEVPFDTVSRKISVTPEVDDALESRYDPELVSRRLSESVALIQKSGLRFEEISSGRAIAILPFRRDFTNQNSSLQASVLHMAADFAAGVALGAALPGTYVLGMHDPCPAMPIQFWTTKSRIEYMRPVECDARIVATLPADAIPRLLKHLQRAGKCIADIEVMVFAAEDQAMSATQTILVVASPWRRLGDKLTPVSEAIERTNALALAGLASGRVRDVSPRVASLADRIVNLAPLLEKMTKATGDAIAEYLAKERSYDQIVWLPGGVHPEAPPSTIGPASHFAIDHESVLAERGKILDKGSAVTTMIPVPADPLGEDWMASLKSAGFGPEQSTLWILRGLSWQLPVADFERLLSRLHTISNDARAEVLVDHFTPEALTNPRFSEEIIAMSRVFRPVLSGYETGSDFPGRSRAQPIRTYPLIWCDNKAMFAASVLTLANYGETLKE